MLLYYGFNNVRLLYIMLCHIIYASPTQRKYMRVYGLKATMFMMGVYELWTTVCTHKYRSGGIYV